MLHNRLSHVLDSLLVTLFGPQLFLVISVQSVYSIIHVLALRILVVLQVEQSQFALVIQELAVVTLTALPALFGFLFKGSSVLLHGLRGALQGLFSLDEGLLQRFFGHLSKLHDLRSKRIRCLTVFVTS